MGGKEFLWSGALFFGCASAACETAQKSAGNTGQAEPVATAQPEPRETLPDWLKPSSVSQPTPAPEPEPDYDGTRKALLSMQGKLPSELAKASTHRRMGDRECIEAMLALRERLRPLDEELEKLPKDAPGWFDTGVAVSAISDCADCTESSASRCNDARGYIAAAKRELAKKR